MLEVYCIYPSPTDSIDLDQILYSAASDQAVCWKRLVGGVVSASDLDPEIPG